MNDSQRKARTTAAHWWETFCWDFTADRFSYQAQTSFSVSSVSILSVWMEAQISEETQELTARAPYCLHQLHSEQQHSEQIQVLKKRQFISLLEEKTACHTHKLCQESDPWSGFYYPTHTDIHTPYTLPHDVKNISSHIHTHTHQRNAHKPTKSLY